MTVVMEDFKNNFNFNSSPPKNTKLPMPHLTVSGTRVLGSHKPTLDEINVLYAQIDKLRGLVPGYAALPEQKGGPFIRMYITQGLLDMMDTLAAKFKAARLEGIGGGGYKVDSKQWDGISFMLTVSSGLGKFCSDADASMFLKEAIWYQIYELIDAAYELS